MAPIIVCAKGGKEPVYITSNIEELIGFTAEEMMALPSFNSVSPRLATSQRQFNRELSKSRGCRFHSYSYEGELRHRDGRRITTDNTVLIARESNHNGECLVINVIRPVCSCGGRMAELWPRLSAESRRLVLNITEALAGL